MRGMTLGRGFKKAVLGALIAGAVLVAGPAIAQSPLGIGTAEPAVSVSGPFAGLFQWINDHQQAFYRSLTNALRAMRDDGAKLWILIGLSFAYGVFHAAGPGHGKAVISSYMLANEVALRRGVALSFASALLQGITAIVVVAAAFLFLRGTAVSMTDATHFLEVASFALVAAFGGWLLWRKLRSMVATSGAKHHDHDHNHHNHGHHYDHHCGHDHAHDASCGCGHSHAPDPNRLGGEKLSWKAGWSAVVAVGMRPCSGALIVLTFSFLNGLWLGGIVSVFAMALGTAITVSALAILAVYAKNRAVALANGRSWGNWVHHGIELCGAFFVLALGLLLLGASLTA